MYLARTCAATVLSIAIFGSVANAHDTFIVPTDTRVRAGHAVQLGLTSGMSFPNLDSTIEPARVQTARYRLAGKTAELGTPTREPRALSFRSVPDAAGLATFWIQLSPRTLELEAGQIAEYMDEIGATADLRARALATAGKQRWRERYTKHAKSFVVVGDAAADRSWADPVGMALEFVLGANPAVLRAGERLPILVLRDGKPFAGFRVGIVGEGNASIDFATTDAKGAAALVVPRAGRWLLRGTDLRAAREPGLEWESDFTTLTFDVR
jgi:uncharacterized GH25 family protein